MKILIIEDDPTLGPLLASYFTRKGYEALWGRNGPDGLAKATPFRPDLVILDVMMPGMDGWEVARRLRAERPTPILMLTAKGAQEDVVHGLELGADDYMRKPFDMQELELRVAAVLRRSQTEREKPNGTFDDGTLAVDVGRRTVTIRGAPVHLTPTEFRLLGYLVGQRGRAVPHTELLREVWGPEYAQDTPSLQVYVRYLREKLEPEPGTPRYIRTEWGVGYRFAD